MQVDLKNISDTKVKIIISCSDLELLNTKKQVVKKLAPTLKIAGFREGRVPQELAEKHLDPNKLQNQVIEEAVNHFYSEAVNQNNIRVVAPPKIEITKFVPYTSLELCAEVDVIGKVILPDYKKLISKKPEVKVIAKDIEEVLARLQLQSAEYKEVDRQAKDGDRLLIDFEGVDSKNQPVNGAKGKDYPLMLGSDTFISGFEAKLIGTKKADKVEFVISFPKDYHLKVLQSKKVTFKVDVKKIEEVIKQEINDDFAKKVGNFKDVKELKEDIKKQVVLERENQAKHIYEEGLIKNLIAKTKLTLPESLIEEQIKAVDQEFRQNLTYRGQTINEYLEGKQITEEQYRETELKPAAIDRLKAGLVLSEVAVKEGIKITPEEVEIRIQILKGQYKDPKMQTELDKPEAKNEIASRLITEKTITKLVIYNTK